MKNKNAKQMTMVGLVVRMLALKVQAAMISARRVEMRNELMKRIRGEKWVDVAGHELRKQWQEGGTYEVHRPAGYRLLVKDEDGKVTTM